MHITQPLTAITDDGVGGKPYTNVLELFLVVILLFVK